MAVYLTLQKNYGDGSSNYDKTMAIQKCGRYPYELALRFGRCCLRCGACFAAGYSWEDKFRQNRRVCSNVPIAQVLTDFRNVPRPPNGRYNWLRILGGEPLLNDEYIEFLLEIVIQLSKMDGDKFNNGIIIQTNGIHIGRGNTTVLKNKLMRLYELNPNVVVVVETSIKGTNREEFNLLSRSDKALFKYNIESYYKLRQLNLRNLRPVIIAGYGISESFLLTSGKNPKSMITILSDEETPTYHPSLWSDEFTKLYNDFVNDYKEFDTMFFKMPMYGIKDQFNYGWVGRAIRQGQEIYGWRWYDGKYAPKKSAIIEGKFHDIIEKFFLKSNQEYYSTLIKEELKHSL